MAVIRPFRGVRYDAKRVSLARALCPPYDIIPAEMARRFRRYRQNAIHLELPEGKGMAKYRRSARQWKRWIKDGTLVADEQPSFYICEETFVFGGKTRRRVGFLAGMGVTPAGAKSVVRHERTLSKPKADRLRILKAVGVNISPIFGLYEDPSGEVRKLLSRVRRSRPDARGRLATQASYRLWKVSADAVTGEISRLLKKRKILIADGHHRFEVGRLFWKEVAAAGKCSKAVRAGAETILVYLCADEDPGLVTQGYHRVVAGTSLIERAKKLCRLTRCRSLKDLTVRMERSKNSCAFGLYEGGCYLAEPKDIRGTGGLGVKWVRERLFAEVDPEDIAYTHDVPRAAAMARKSKGAAVLVKPVRVGEIRRAVASIGLLPQKSTYFFPKVPTGLVFKSLRRG